MNLVTDDAILAAAEGRGVDPIEFDACDDERRERLEAVLADRGVARVPFHRGDYGTEPIPYGPGASAVEAAELAGDLAGAAFGTA